MIKLFSDLLCLTQEWKVPDTVARDPLVALPFTVLWEHTHTQIGKQALVCRQVRNRGKVREVPEIRRVLRGQSHRLWQQLPKGRDNRYETG